MTIEPKSREQMLEELLEVSGVQIDLLITMVTNLYSLAEIFIRDIEDEAKRAKNLEQLAVTRDMFENFKRNRK